MSLRPAERPTLESAAAPGRSPSPPPATGCTRCAGLAEEVARLRGELAEARRDALRARRRTEMVLRYLPEQLGIPAEPPLRYRIADRLNRALQQFPGAHARLRRAIESARASIERARAGRDDAGGP